MSVSDIRDKLRNERLSKMTDTTELLEEGLSLIVQQGIQGIMNGSVKVNDLNDMQRAWTIMKEVGDFNTVMANEGKNAGQLPELRAREALALGIPDRPEDALVGEEQTVDLSALSDEDIEKMATDFANAINNENASLMDSSDNSY